MTDVDLLVEPLLQELEEGFDGVQVAAIGGGHGLAAALRAILDYADVVTGVVGVADDGGSSGRLAPGLDIPPPGDIRRALLAVTDQPSLWRSLIEYRFEDSDVAGHSLGNLIIAAMAEIGGDFAEAVNTVGRMLGTRGAVIPVAPTRLDLEADVDGAVVRGQVAVARSRGVITDVRVLPEGVAASPRALEALEAADQIVLGPGSLFTSLIAPLKVPGVVESVNRSEASLVYVCNLTTQDGETLGLTGLQHLEALIAIGGLRTPDAIVAHDGPLAIPPGLDRVELDHASLGDAGIRLETGDVADPDADWPQHDAARLGAVLRRLVP
ncbi:MAG: uridine diphosphate-N-acetylglucosamine-binding protein YvcK [Acidimicrobiia bacterium]